MIPTLRRLERTDLERLIDLLWTLHEQLSRRRGPSHDASLAALAGEAQRLQRHPYRSLSRVCECIVALAAEREITPKTPPHLPAPLDARAGFSLLATIERARREQRPAELIGLGTLDLTHSEALLYCRDTRPPTPAVDALVRALAQHSIVEVYELGTLSRIGDLIQVRFEARSATLAQVLERIDKAHRERDLVRIDGIASLSDKQGRYVAAIEPLFIDALRWGHLPSVPEDERPLAIELAVFGRVQTAMGTFEVRDEQVHFDGVARPPRSQPDPFRVKGHVALDCRTPGLMVRLIGAPSMRHVRRAVLHGATPDDIRLLHQRADTIAVLELHEPDGDLLPALAEHAWPCLRAIVGLDDEHAYIRTKYPARTGALISPAACLVSVDRTTLEDTLYDWCIRLTDAMDARLMRPAPVLRESLMQLRATAEFHADPCATLRAWLECSPTTDEAVAQRLAVAWHALDIAIGGSREGRWGLDTGYIDRTARAIAIVANPTALEVSSYVYQAMMSDLSRRTSDTP